MGASAFVIIGNKGVRWLILLMLVPTGRMMPTHLTLIITMDIHIGFIVDVEIVITQIMSITM